MPERVKTVTELTAERQQDAILGNQYGGLSKREYDFVHAYVHNGMKVREAWNSTGGKAGDSVSYAYSILAKPAAEKLVATLLAERREKEKLSTGLVIKAFLRIAHAAESEGSWSNALRAWENLARYLGMFVERSESNVMIEERTQGQTVEEMTDNIKRLISQQVTKKSNTV